MRRNQVEGRARDTGRHTACCFGKTESIKKENVLAVTQMHCYLLLHKCDVVERVKLVVWKWRGRCSGLVLNHHHLCTRVDSKSRHQGAVSWCSLGKRGRHASDYKHSLHCPPARQWLLCPMILLFCGTVRTFGSTLLIVCLCLVLSVIFNWLYQSWKNTALLIIFSLLNHQTNSFTWGRGGSRTHAQIWSVMSNVPSVTEAALTTPAAVLLQEH